MFTLTFSSLVHYVIAL